MDTLLLLALGLPVWGGIIWLAHRLKKRRAANAPRSGWVSQGPAAWVGGHSIYNTTYSEQKSNVARYSLPALVFGLPMFLFLLVWMTGGYTINPEYVSSVIFGSALALIFGWAIWRIVTLREWITLPWSLSVSDGRFRYISEDISKAKKTWSIEEASISSIEVGRTKEYTPGRDFGGHGWRFDFGEVSPHEFQVFLHCDDNTRHVIHIANADRDGCAALRASIAAYVDRARSASAAPSAASSTPAASPSGEAFDL